MKSLFFTTVYAVFGLSGCANQTANTCHEPEVLWHQKWLASPEAATTMAQTEPITLTFLPAKGGVAARARLLAPNDPSAKNQAKTLEFFDLGNLVVQGACRSSTASISADRCEVGHTFRISIGPMTNQAENCQTGNREQESRYLDALKKAQRYEVNGDTLLIHTQGMDQPLRFVRTAPRS